ncbi:SET domain-containing protein, partial [Mycena rebaudengoi]
ELDELALATNLVDFVYQEVYEEFRIWKHDYASKILASLATRPRSRVSSVSIANNSTDSGYALGPPSTSSATTVEYIEVWDYETETMGQMPVDVTHMNNAFPAPFSAHEFCTPISRNVFLGDDPRAMPFMPFEDDPSFNHVEYLDAFDGQADIQDPDLEVVVVETARRLHTEHKMPYQHIDETGVLPLKLMGTDGQRGMLYKSHRRDFPDWPEGVPASAKQLRADPDNPLRDKPDPADQVPDQKLANLISTFCTNLNCVVPFCSTHLDPTPLPLSNPPTLTSTQMADLVGSPCGEECFLARGPAGDVVWSAEDTQILRVVLHASPDTLPCDLAIICRKPCYEALHFRRSFMPHAEIKKKAKAKSSNKLRLGNVRSLKFDDFDMSRFTPGPCRHEGPCDAETQCPCFLNHSHCESGCRCSRACARRWRGCTCALSKRARCRTKLCPCFLAHRECDPELCLKCQARDVEANVCQNTSIQNRRHKGTEVRPATWGRGLFITEEANEDDLIIEYVGEVIFEPTTESRHPVATYRGRNYLFKLNSTTSIDSTYAGDNSRFINHDSERANSKAHGASPLRYQCRC